MSAVLASVRDPHRVVRVAVAPRMKLQPGQERTSGRPESLAVALGSDSWKTSPHRLEPCTSAKE